MYRNCAVPGELPDFKTGALPENAPLANPYVPFQKENSPQFRPEEGLTRGTIYPGLELPWKNSVNKYNPATGTDIGQIMALDFAIDELQLYLDTHQSDTEAAKLLEYYVGLSREAKRQYEGCHGPLSRDEAAKDGKYKWLQDPWPWDYQERMD